ncbi:hypothetical protein ADL27_55065 [Streptomyces sp. NRRL F-6602]|nr:hypothetical protein ADL27_55065 [Streptomyces sp. NRRL F-6602]
MHADATEVIETCADITDGTNIHPAIRKIAAGLVEIVEDTTLDLAATALVLGQLAAAADSNLVHAIGATIAHLTSPANPALAHLNDDQAKETTRYGYLARLDLQDPDLTTNTSNAIAALCPPEEVNTMRLTEEQRKELSKQVAKANKQSSNRPR